MEISVVIPTHKRPAMLRSTLSSVAAQSRVDLIREVVVSENGSDDRSRAVCKEFGQLPLRYVQRVPELPGLIHFQTLVEEAASPQVAWIADDDMWGRYHLEEAERLLTQLPNASAFAANCVMVNDELRNLMWCYAVHLRSLAPHPTGYPDHELWGERELMLESLLRTPLNLWGVVCRREVMLAAVKGWKCGGDSWCNDRIFWCHLVRFGPLVVGREVSLFVRAHAAAASVQYHRNQEARNAASAGITSEILELAAERGINLREVWDSVWAEVPEPARRQYLSQCLPGALSGLRKLWGDAAVGVTEPAGWAAPLKTMGRDCCPPIVWRALGKVRRQRS